MSTLPLPAPSPARARFTPRLSVAIPRRATSAYAASSSSSYRFLADAPDAVVYVAVGGKNGAVTVGVDASLPQSTDEDFFLSWTTSRGEETETPLSPTSAGNYSAVLEFDPSLAPFYLSFVLDSANSVVRTHRKTNFRVPVGVGAGRPLPLGVSLLPDGTTNFALFAENADRVVLCLFDDSGDPESPAVEIELDGYVNRTASVWHLSVGSLSGYVAYGYRIGGSTDEESGAGKVLLDPYARVIRKAGSEGRYLGTLSKPPSFDWAADTRPSLAMEEMVVYRANVRSFTMDRDSELCNHNAGTFAGLAGKIGHFKSLGVNAILLEPVFPFGESMGQYSPHHFFSPTGLYSGEDDEFSAIVSMKEMVRTLHAGGIEVLLEVAFTGFCDVSSSSEDTAYYIAGVGKGLSCNHAIVQQLILESLRHWVREYHVDGFCFVDASHLALGPDGSALSRPPLLEAIAFDPVLSKTKIIAEAWSPVDASPAKTLPYPHWKRWAEMNARYCTDVRNFLSGGSLLSNLATRLCGSGDLFSSRGPAFSFNYIARNSGLALVDLVSFSVASEYSWNCGEEGPTDNPLILETRLRQIRNFLLVLFVSQGVPVLNMGDECGLSTGGLLYKERPPMNWKSIRTPFARQVIQFISFLTSLRHRRRDIFQRKEFLKAESITWHGTDHTVPTWEDPMAKFLCMTVRAEADGEGDMFICFNAGNEPGSAVLPELQDGSTWLRLVDTALPFPGFFAAEADPGTAWAAGLSAYQVLAHSCALFEAKRRAA